jgi:transposase
MDTSTLVARADTRGRKVVPRQFRSLQEKLRIIGEARMPGASVAAVARVNGVNANLIFAWMRQHEQGLLAAKTRAPALLAVTVDPNAPKAGPTPARAVAAAERIEVEFPDGTLVRSYGAVAWEGVERVLRLLRR